MGGLYTDSSNLYHETDDHSVTNSRDLFRGTVWRIRWVLYSSSIYIPSRENIEVIPLKRHGEQWCVCVWEAGWISYTLMQEGTWKIYCFYYHYPRENEPVILLNTITLNTYCTCFAYMYIPMLSICRSVPRCVKSRLTLSCLGLYYVYTQHKLYAIVTEGPMGFKMDNLAVSVWGGY